MLILAGDPVTGSLGDDKRPKANPPLFRPYPPIPLRDLLPQWWKLVYPVGKAGPMGNTLRMCAREEADALVIYCLHCGQPRHQRFRHQIRMLLDHVPEAESIAYQPHIWDAPGRYRASGEEWDETTVTPHLAPLACRWGAIIERGIVGSLDRIR